MTKLFVNRVAMWVLALALGIPFAVLAKDGNPPAKLKVDATAINRDVRTGNSYSSVLKKVTPSVVNIYSTKTVKPPPRYHQFFDDPMFDRFFGGGSPSGRGRRGPNNFKSESLGSGVIVTEDGYILTNNHVVEGADTDGVKVALGDGKQKLSARVVGMDPQTDIAVLKVEGKDLPTITIADSDKLEVGDVVLAVGNPFNVGQTVTMGIVSALGRGGFGITDYEDFIQTDAAINMGNSGGALVDTQGRLIGINQSILSGSGGGNVGVGFAVPINQARAVMERLVDYGKVTRGYLGVAIQSVTPELARMFKLAETSGALVGGVSPNTPAAEAGLKEGDVITEINGKKAADSRHLRLMISQTAPGTKVTLTAVRDGKAKAFTAKLGELPVEEAETAGLTNPTEKNERDALDGVEVGDLSSVVRRENSIPSEMRGVLVANVDPDSNAYEAGLRAGNVILEIDRTPVRSADEAVKLCDGAKGDQLLLRVWSREGGASGTRFLTVDNTKKK